MESGMASVMGSGAFPGAASGPSGGYPGESPNASAGAPPQSASGATTGALSPSAISPEVIADIQNIAFAGLILTALTVFAIILLVHRLANTVHRYLRTIACVQNEKQSYFKQPAPIWAKIKQHIIYAPLFRVRHHREIFLMKIWPLGTLPGRFQSFFLAGLIAMNVTLSLIGLPFQAGISSATFLTALQNRTGTVAVTNLLPLAQFVDKGNPLIGILDISYDAWNMAHRWLGRIIVAEVVTHSTAYILRQVWYNGGWAALAKSLQAAGQSQTGLIVSQTVLYQTNCTNC